MRQIYRELLVENSSAVCLAGKFAFLFIILFGSVIFHDFPYTIIFVYALTSFEIYLMKMHGQIDYMLPQTNYEKKRSVIIKSVIVAGTYSLANTAGYVLLILRRADCGWGYDTILFLIYMTALIFLYFFYYRTGLCLVGCSRKELEKEMSVSTLGIAIQGFGCLLAVVTCPVYIAYKFGKIGYPPFLMKNMGIIELCCGAAAIIFLSCGLISNIRRLDYSEYSG